MLILSSVKQNQTSNCHIPRYYLWICEEMMWFLFSYSLCDSSTRSFQNLCSGDWPIFLSLFLLGASLLLVSARLSHNMEWCKYILYPFKTKFIDHIFSSWNFWVSPSSDKVKAEVSSVPSSVPLEPGFSPSGGVGISRGMGVIPSLPGSLLLAQTFLHSSLGAMQGFVCTVMCTAPVFKCKSICSCWNMSLTKSQLNILEKWVFI